MDMEDRTNLLRRISLLIRYTLNGGCDPNNPGDIRQAVNDLTLIVAALIQKLPIREEA